MSETIIDSLIITLGLDPSKFKAGSDQANKNLADIKKHANEARSQLKALTETLVGLFAAFTGATGLKDFVSDITASNTQLERLGRRLDTTIPQLSAWGNIVARNGGSVEGLQGDLQKLSMQMTEMAVTGTSSMLPYLRALGVHLSDTAGHALPVLDILTSIGQELHDKTPSLEAANNLGLMMGFSQGTLNTILQGKDAIAAMLKDEQMLNPVTEKQTQASEKLTMAYWRMKQAGEGMGRGFVALITPALTKFFDLITRGEVYLRQHEFLLIGIAGALTSFVIPAFIRAGVAIAGFILPIVGIPLLIAAAIAGLGLLADDWYTWFTGGKSALADFWQSWADLWHKIGNSKEMVKEAVLNALGPVGNLIRGTIHGYNVAGIPGIIFGGIAGVIDGAPKVPPPHKGILEPFLGIPQVTGKARPGNKTDAVKYFESHGWSHEQAAGIVANLWAESGLQSIPQKGGGPGFGAGQWERSRQRDFRDWFGKDIRESSLDDQYGFVDYELRRGKEQKAGGILGQQTSAQGSGEILSRYYERPADAEGSANARGHLADVIAQQTAAGQPSNFNSRIANNTHTNSSETNIGTINVVTQATDAKAIAADLPRAITSHNLSNQADSGLN